MKKIIAPLLIITLVIACNNRNNREYALKDLEVKQKVLTEMNQQVEELNMQNIKMIGELEVAIDRIDQAKQFQFLRTENEREQQIRKASEYKLSIEQNIENLKKQLIELQDSVKQTEIKIEEIKEFLKN
jgi:hypothetical protein